jgi:hypothetical protein
MKAIGNEAVACSDGGAEQVVGRVREHAFLVRLSGTPGARVKVRGIAEQVAGILF